MELIKGYYSASIRGVAGNNVTDKEYEINLAKGIRRGREIKRWMGEILELYIPHEHDAIIHRMWRNGQVEMDAILGADFEIVKTSDFMLVDGYLSDGVKSEIDIAVQVGVPVIFLHEDLLLDIPDISAIITQTLFILEGRDV